MLHVLSHLVYQTNGNISKQDRDTLNIMIRKAN